MIIDAKDLLLGRMGTVVAKKALLGEAIDIVNCEESVLSGNKDKILSDYKETYDRGIPKKGPFHHKMPDRLVRRMIRGMLPYKKERGKEAYKRIRCFVGVPEDMKDQKMETIKEANADKLPTIKYTKVKDVCKYLGAKI